MEKLKVLNLYAGEGKNRELWPDSKIEVTAVELVPKIAATYQKKFPNDKVIIGDAHEVLLVMHKDFDFIWSSRPCVTHTDCNYFLYGQGIFRYPDFMLWQEVIFLNRFYKGKWVVENVIPYYELDLEIKPQNVGRHYFWANFIIPKIKLPDIDIGTFNRSASKMKQDKAKKNQIARNGVNPKLGLHIFNCAFKIKQERLTGGNFTPNGVVELGLNGSATAPPKVSPCEEKPIV